MNEPSPDPLFDTHCHLQSKEFEDTVADVLDRSREAGVVRFLVPAVDTASIAGTLKLASEYSDVFIALGIHPHTATEWTEELSNEIFQEASSNPKVCAIGEIGLDYHYDFSPRDVQRRAFEAQIELAQRLGKPIVIHTRESEDDLWRIVEERYTDYNGPTGQFHCFSAGVDLMQKAVALGFYVSFTGNITFKKSTLEAVVREAPLERILLETDSPYMAPVPFRGKVNTPQYLNLVAEKIAGIKEIAVSKVIRTTFENANRLFRLPALVIALLLLFGVTSARAQHTGPVGGAAPDSVLTDQRRKNEEQLRKQRQELEREQAQRRQDSIRAAEQQQLQDQLKAIQQAKEDSTKAAQRIADEELARLKAMTPVAWKAIGIGGGIGIGNMQMNENKHTPTPTSVFASTLQIGTQISRVFDFEASYSHMVVADIFQHDSEFNFGQNTFTGGTARVPFVPGLRLVDREDIAINSYSFDLRFLIAPKNPLKFYLGLGYSYLVITNTQVYNQAVDSFHISSTEQTLQSSFHRGAIKILFGMRYDIELGSGFTLTPFAQISALAALQGEQQLSAFVFRPDPQQITMTQLTAGVTLYFGWFSVERLH